jgi:hypothetical protein
MTSALILNSHPVAHLRQEISKTNIKGYSKMKKDDIVALMMKTPERFNHIEMYVKPKKAPAPAPKKAPAPKGSKIVNIEDEALKEVKNSVEGINLDGVKIDVYPMFMNNLDGEIKVIEDSGLNKEERTKLYKKVFAKFKPIFEKMLKKNKPKAAPKKAPAPAPAPARKKRFQVAAPPGTKKIGNITESALEEQKKLGGNIKKIRERFNIIKG